MIIINYNSSLDYLSISAYLSSNIGDVLFYLTATLRIMSAHSKEHACPTLHFNYVCIWRNMFRKKKNLMKLGYTP